MAHSQGVNALVARASKGYELGCWPAMQEMERGVLGCDYGGTSWTTLASETTTAALTLNASDLMRFVPAANYNSSATALSANLIESGQTITSGGTLNLTGATGGTTHHSSGTGALN